MRPRARRPTHFRTPGRQEFADVRQATGRMTTGSCHIAKNLRMCDRNRENFPEIYRIAANSWHQKPESARKRPAGVAQPQIPGARSRKARGDCRSVPHSRKFLAWTSGFDTSLMNRVFIAFRPRLCAAAHRHMWLCAATAFIIAFLLLRCCACRTAALALRLRYCHSSSDAAALQI